jgi:hypothetical protein
MKSGQKGLLVSHEPNSWVESVKDIRSVVSNEMIDQFSIQMGLFDSSLIEKAQQTRKDIIENYNEIINLEIRKQSDRRKIYEINIVENEDLKSLKRAFDLWSSLWFWPLNEIDHAPTPSDFMDSGDETIRISHRLAERFRFFHWELEFPDVFGVKSSGFDAIITNPPWDILKPLKQEFFSNIDPMFRSYGGHKADEKIRDMFTENPDVEYRWLEYCEAFKCYSNWKKYACLPFGDPQEFDAGPALRLKKQGAEEKTLKNQRSKYSLSFSRSRTKNETAHSNWRRVRAETQILSNKEYPYQHQGGGDTNLYKLFCEQSIAVLRPGGQLGVVLPSGVYSQTETAPLRRRMFDESGLSWLAGFDNSKGLFPIDSRFQFCVVIIHKDVPSPISEIAFGYTEFSSWASVQTKTTQIDRKSLVDFTPKSRVIMQVESPRHLEILKNIYKNSILLGIEPNWSIHYRCEFHMANDKKKFKTYESLARKGLTTPEHGVWSSDEKKFVCLYTGKLIWQYDYAFSKWLSGHGNKSKWEQLDHNSKGWFPEYLMPMENIKNIWQGGVRLAYRDITNATNERTTVAALIPAWPCGHKVPYIYDENEVGITRALALCAIMNSFVYDLVVRTRMTDINLTKSILDETPVPKPASIPRMLPLLSARLSLTNEIFAKAWLELADEHPVLRSRPWKDWWAVDKGERRRTRALIEALVADAYGLDRGINDRELLRRGQYAWIVDIHDVRPKGFHRVDKELPEAARLPILALQAFIELRNNGYESLAPSPMAEGWRLPDDALSLFPANEVDGYKKGDLEKSWEYCEELAESYEKLWDQHSASDKEFRKQSKKQTQLRLNI